MAQRWPTARRWGNTRKDVNKRILRDIYRWEHDDPNQANLKTLERLVQTEADEQLIQDILRLKQIDPENEKQLPDDAPKFPCPICKSIIYLVATDRPKILICERPTCIYKRAIESRNRLVKDERNEHVS